MAIGGESFVAVADRGQSRDSRSSRPEPFHAHSARWATRYLNGNRDLHHYYLYQRWCASSSRIE